MTVLIVMPEFMNRSVIFVMMLKSVYFGSVSRPMTIIVFFVTVPWGLIPSATIVRPSLVSVAPLMPGAEMFFIDLFMMPVISAIRPGSTHK
jgi:hypothetical protein